MRAYNFGAKGSSLTKLMMWCAARRGW